MTAESCFIHLYSIYMQTPMLELASSIRIGYGFDKSIFCKFPECLQSWCIYKYFCYYVIINQFIILGFQFTLSPVSILNQNKMFFKVESLVLNMFSCNQRKIA